MDKNKFVRREMIRLARRMAAKSGQTTDQVLAEMGEPPLSATPWAVSRPAPPPRPKLSAEERAEKRRAYQRSEAYKKKRKARRNTDAYREKRRLKRQELKRQELKRQKMKHQQTKRQDAKRSPAPASETRASPAAGDPKA